MAYPTLTKSGAPTVTFSRGPTFPSEHVWTPRQIVGISEAGQVRVATLSVPDEMLPVKFERLPQADIEAFLAFGNHVNVNWAAHTVTWTDVDSVAWTVRILHFLSTQVAYRLHDLQVDFRKEIA
jgi:hypothetical protein